MHDTCSQVGFSLGLVTRTASVLEEIGDSSRHVAGSVQGIAYAIRE